MTLNQALSIVNSPKNGKDGEIYFLICGFEPLHLATFFRAHLLGRLTDGKNPQVQHGIYGDLRGNIELAAKSAAIGSAIALEWSDIDPRLGLRASGGWSNETKADVLRNCAQSFAQLELGIEKLAARMPIALAPPSLPLPPIGYTIRAQSSVFEMELEHQLSAFLLHLSRLNGVRILARQHAEVNRLDARMELLAGFPYTTAFADALATSFVTVLVQPVPKKALITDLDDTLWAGLIGEVGVAGVSWSQDSHTQAHGLYQQMLGHLSGCGVLLGVCSKNEMSTVEAGLARKDLFLDPASLFPVCANWGPKSKSISQILRTWNIGADAVVFVDDNPMELEEVRQAHPGITCFRFSGKDPASVWNLIGELRDLFGKPLLMEEDRLRQASIRASVQMQQAAQESASPEFLRSLDGNITIDWSADSSDKRALELINKTNQFNLNGKRIGEGEWRRLLEHEDTVMGVASYQDKFGPLGKVAVLVATQRGSKVIVSHWVMSCRAFSRRLEHHMLDSLIRHANVDEVEFSFEATEKNQPLREFFDSLSISMDGPVGRRITRAAFLASCGALPHQVSNLTKVKAG